MIRSETKTISPSELYERIAAAKAKLGSSLVVLGHHYQRDEVVRFADFKGDSFQLSAQVADRKDAKYIVFCGVRFMAEIADILTAPHQQVILPEPTAGCSLADMADLRSVEECWQALTCRSGNKVIPITYVNSSAELKSFCGEHDGIVCTSSNAYRAFQWAVERCERILFFPDEHLGRNTADKLGFSPSEIAVWNSRLPQGGLSTRERDYARIVLWKGCCPVHMQFGVEHVRAARERYPGVRVIVHSECRREVVAESDFDGSTEHIIRVVSEAPANSTWAVGTDANLVFRLASQFPDKHVFSLKPDAVPCPTMNRTRASHLCQLLEALVDGRVPNRIQVAPETARWARVALDRMLELARR